MSQMLKMAGPLLLAVLALTAFEIRIRKEMPDFAVYRRAAVRAVHAQPLYGQPEDGHYQFKYLPAFALLTAPLALMDAEGGKALWFALSVGLLTAFLRWSVRALPERRWSERTLIGITVVLMAKFYLHELLLGQTNGLLGALLIGALLTLQIELAWPAGALIGAAVFVKPYALILLPWLVVSARRQAWLTALAVIAFGLVLPAVVYGWSGNLALLRDWFRTVGETTGPNLLGADNISLAAMTAKWFGPGPVATWLAGGLAAALLGCVVLLRVRRTAVSSPEFLEYAALMLLIPLLSPQGWDYVLLLATPAVVCLIDRWRETNVGWRLLTGAALVLMCLTYFDVLGRELYGRFMSWSIVTVGAITLAAALGNLRARALA